MTMEKIWKISPLFPVPPFFVSAQWMIHSNTGWMRELGVSHAWLDYWTRSYMTLHALWHSIHHPHYLNLPVVLTKLQALTMHFDWGSNKRTQKSGDMQAASKTHLRITIDWILWWLITPSAAPASAYHTVQRMNRSSEISPRFAPSATQLAVLTQRIMYALQMKPKVISRRGSLMPDAASCGAFG